MAQWKIGNAQYYTEVTADGVRKRRFPKSIRRKIPKPWTAVYIGPDYHDAKAVGRFATWEQAIEYVKMGGTPYVINER